MLTAKQITAFRKEILLWFAKNKRDLPWRHSRDPYNILISEVMLQQTQVSRVIPKFDAWMKRFPTVHVLAKASVHDVLSLWSGLGYNRRALYLQKLAMELVKNHKSEFPQDEMQLRKLPGIGEYTARALLCFAFNKQVAVVDTNVKKVIAVTFFKGKVPEQKVLQQIAEQLLPKGKAYEWNQALMDYASAELKKEKIAIPKQSTFKDSDRFYRGEIVRVLLKNKTISLAQLENHLQKAGKGIQKERLEKIILSLEKNGFIQYEKKQLILEGEV